MEEDSACRNVLSRAWPRLQVNSENSADLAPAWKAGLEAKCRCMYSVCTEALGTNGFCSASPVYIQFYCFALHILDLPNQL